MEKNTSKSFNIGLIGFGFIGKLHTNAYHNIPYCFKEPAATAHIQAVLRTKPGSDQRFLENIKVNLVTANSDDFYDQPLDVVDICTPNKWHREQVLEALKHRKHVYCEKPLGRTLADARLMADSAHKAGVFTHVALMMRYIPAVRQMKAVIDGGGIGEVHHFRAHLFHCSYLDPQRPMSWRLYHSEAGGGALADLGIHLLDLTRFMLGEVEWVQCNTRIFIHHRPAIAGRHHMEKVDVDDWALCTLGMQCGATGLVEVTRVSGGTNESTQIEIIGSRGTVKVNFIDPLTAHYFDAKRNQWLVGPQDFPSPTGMRPIEQIWPDSKRSLGFMLNAHLASAYDYLLWIQEGKSSPINFDTALAAQEILEAAYLSADKNGQRINLPLD